MDGYPPGAIWPAQDEDEMQIREVYSRYGLAMYQAHVLEHGMVNTIMVFRLLPTMRDFANEAAWQAAFDRFYEAELAKTFGNIVRSIEALQEYPEDLLQRLRAAKHHRDRLAHRFFREHDQDFLSRSGRTAMIVECEEIVELFTALDRDMEAHAEPHRSRGGVTKEWIDRQLAQAEQEERARDE